MSSSLIAGKPASQALLIPSYEYVTNKLIANLEGSDCVFSSVHHPEGFALHSK